MSTFNFTQSCANFASALSSYEATTVAINREAAQQREAGIVYALRESKDNPCPNKAILRAALSAAFPKAPAKRLQNYETAFIAAVRTGKPFALGNAKKAKSGAKRAPSEFSTLLAKLAKHDEFAGFLQQLQEMFEDDQGTLPELVLAYLQESGEE